MSWWIKGVGCNSFSHRFLQCHTICVMYILLICRIQDCWFKVSNIFSFVKCEVFICVIRDKYVDRCPAFTLVNAINDVNVWVLSFGSTVICQEVCIVISGPLIWTGTTPLCLDGILRVDLTVPTVTV